MSRIAIAGLACLAVLFPVAVVAGKAFIPSPAPVPVRVAAATTAYLGKVTAVSEKAVAAEMYKGDTRQMKVATVRVGETLIGKGAREVKVGFFLAGGPGRGRMVSPQLAVGQEGVVMLHKHPTMKDVYVFSDMFGYVAKTGNPNFAKELADVKAATKLLADPMKGLKSKDAAERYQAVAMLVTRYKTAPGSETKREKVPAAESKLILETLADADWAPRPGVLYQMNAQNIFARLGVTAKDGFTPPRNFAEYPTAAKKWLKENAGKYEITRYVRETGVSEEPGPASK